MNKKELKKIVSDDLFVKKLTKFLALPNINIVSEDKLFNGIKTDFCFYNNDNKIISILECQDDNVNVTNYINTVGKIFQYEYLQQKNKRQQFSLNCFILLCITETLMEKINIYDFIYPKTMNILVINEQREILQFIGDKEFKKYYESQDKLISISPYYFRDIRIGEIFITLKEIVKTIILKPKIIKIKRDDYEDLLEKYETPNKKCIRNVFISLSSINFIDVNNLPTSKGIQMSLMPFEEFCFSLINTYYFPFIKVIFNGFDIWRKEIDSYNINVFKNEKLIKIIESTFSSKEVNFLTTSNGRYISSWLTCLKDDVGCIDFLPNKETKEIKFNFNPFDFKGNVVKNIKKYSKIEYVQKYLNKY